MTLRNAPPGSSWRRHAIDGLGVKPAEADGDARLVTVGRLVGAKLVASAERMGAEPVGAMEVSVL
jgi:hypothetical protein